MELLRFITIHNCKHSFDIRENYLSERDLKKAEAQQQQPAVVAPVIQAPIVYQGSPTMTAMQVRKEKEAELFANDQYWANRLKNQEAEFLKNSKIMEKEFNDTVCSGS
jgi:hypothetical protein